MSATNPNARLEAFCDGVFAIAITLLVIDIKIPSTMEVGSTSEFWHALKHISPSISAFLLSFTIILITWVNHHHTIKLLDKSSNSFIYANGLLLLTVAFVPFPTSLLGEYVLTSHGAPAVVLYDAVLAVQAIGWILLLGSALKHKLCSNENSIKIIKENRKFGFFALALYSLLAIVAFWFPLTAAIITTITWLFWLILSNTMKSEEIA